jgi:large subunit ribosomal protein L3
VEQVTTRNLRVVKVDADKGIIYVNGSVPGHRGGVVVLKKV